jgi:hypothetical protein
MFYWLTMMQIRESSLLNRGARRFESFWSSWGFLTTRYMQVLDLHISTLTWILQNVNGAPLENTVLYLPAPTQRFHRMGTLLSPSLHSQCAVVLSHNGIAEVLGLPEYVASTAKSQLTQVYNGTVLNRHRPKHCIKTPFSLQATRPVSI